MSARVLLSLLVLACASWADARQVAVTTDPDLPAPARHGLAVLETALAAAGWETAAAPGAAGFHIVAGLAGKGGPAELLLRDHQVPRPDQPEALVVNNLAVDGKPTIVICGADARGLMYGLLDTAERLGLDPPSGNPFASVRDIRESPRVRERAVSMYTMQRRWFEQRLHDEGHWRRWFALLAESRINSFVVIFGYENGGFMAPAYPYFHDVEGFPDVRMVGVDAAQQARNTAAFNRMIAIAHACGVDVTVAFWDHIYRGKVQGGGIPGASEAAGRLTRHLVTGVRTDNLVAYNKAAMTRFLQVFPEIDAIQFRMHWESGLTREETPAFWHDMFAIIRAARPDLRIDLRAKGLPDPVIDDAVRQGLRFRIATKFWMEQMGLPFHPTHVNRPNQRDRRHGYADLLRFPQRYPMHWRLWNGGTTRFLLWGDPDYVRRFTESAAVYGGDSFEVNEMLATKMLGEDHDAEPFALLNPAYRFSDDEFERYWHYYRVWGRVGYNPDLPDTDLQRGFTQRFGPECGPYLMQGLHLASKVLPRIVAAAYSYRNFPTTRGWAEMMRQGDLPEFAKAEGSDIAQFMNFADGARILLEGGETAMRRPGETSRWFAETSQAILREVSAAEARRTGPPGAEYLTTVTDLRILAHLAQYYADRIPAAVSYNIYLQTKDPRALEDAIGRERAATAAWRRIVDAAGDIYSPELAFGVERVGFPRHWRDELVRLEQGIADLQAELRDAPAPGRDTPRPPRIPDRPDAAGDHLPPVATIEPLSAARPGVPLTVAAAVHDASGVRWVRLRYRHLTQFEDYQTLEMRQAPGTERWTATIPGAFIVPEWDLVFYLEVMDQNGNGRILPDLEQETPYVVVGLNR